MSPRPWLPPCYTPCLCELTSFRASCKGAGAGLSVWLISLCSMSGHRQHWEPGSVGRCASCVVLCCCEHRYMCLSWDFCEVSASMGTVFSSARNSNTQHLVCCKETLWHFSDSMWCECVFMTSQRKMPPRLSDACLSKMVTFSFLASMWISHSQNHLGFLVCNLDIFKNTSPSIYPIKDILFLYLTVMFHCSP